MTRYHVAVGCVFAWVITASAAGSALAYRVLAQWADAMPVERASGVAFCAVTALTLLALSAEWRAKR